MTRDNTAPFIFALISSKTAKKKSEVHRPLLGSDPQPLHGTDEVRVLLTIVLDAGAICALCDSAQKKRTHERDERTYESANLACNESTQQ